MTPTPEERVAAARARMGELAEKFTERTRGEVDVMRARLAAIDAGDSTALGDIRNLSHRICGTGATLGFETLAERAHEIEKLAAAHEPGIRLDARVMHELAGAIERLAREIR
jgi:chemotaxis protein histidine kinase CheA